MRRVALAGFGWVLVTSGCGARSGFEAWTFGGGNYGELPSTAGSPALGAGGSSNQGGASNGGAGNAAAGASPGSGGAISSTPPIATAISVGTDMACALLSDGSVRCWGSNDQGQLGDGTITSTGSSPPVRVPDISNATAIATGGTWTAGGKGAASSAYGCALLADRSVKCWGRFPGRPYDQSVADSPRPATIAGLTDVVAIAAGNWHACALLANGSVQCWGDASEGELGNGVVTTCKPWSCPPNTIGTIPVPAALKGVTSISGQGSNGSCAVLTTGEVACWGSFMMHGTSDHLPFVVLGVLTTPNHLSAGYNHACAVTASGGVQCWQGNVNLVAVGGFAHSVVAVSAGLEHTCALLDNGTVECWPEAPAGSTKAPTHRPAPDISNAIAVSAGYSQTCALIRGGNVRCWVGAGGGKVETINGF